MSYLNVGPVTQFATTATCDFVLKKANLAIVGEKGPLLCSVLSPAIQAAGSYIYHSAIQKTSDVPPSFNDASSLSPLEEAGAGTIGAYAGYRLLKSAGDTMFNLLTDKGTDYYPLAMRVNDLESSSLMRAYMAVTGTMGVTKLAGLLKQTYLQTYSSQGSPPTSEHSPIIRTQA